MRSGILPTLLVTLLAFSPASARAATPLPDYTGHYVLIDTKANRSFNLDVTQKKSRADVSFSAAMADGSGAAPDGTGKGRVEDGILSFKFKDSFANEGTCTFHPGKGGFALSMTVVKLVDVSPLHFYGTIALKKVSAEPPK